MLSQKDPTPNVYARPFVPQRFRDINNAPATILPSQPPSWIDFDAFTRSFGGSAFLLPQTSNDQHAKISESPSDTVLNQSNYDAYWHQHLTAEENAQKLELDDQAMYKVPIARAARDPRPCMFALHKPGLRETRLRIEVGDVVELRQLRLASDGMPVLSPVFGDLNGQPLPAIGNMDVQHDATVWALDRNNEIIILRVDKLSPRTMLFNVCFTLQKSRLEALHIAVTITQSALRLEDRRSWLRSMLFPEPGDGALQRSLGSAIFKFEPFDELLNHEQLRAVDAAANADFGRLPYLIFGPPGTGKTKTLVELALQLVKQSPAAHLLVCAPSDPAADTLLQRLSKHLRSPRELLRLNSPSRSFPEVPNSVLPYCCIQDDLFTLPSFESLMRLRIVVTSCRDADLLRQARVSNRDLFALEQSLHATIHPSSVIARPELHWTCLLLDEAAQGLEPESLIPLTVVQPPDSFAELDLPASKLLPRVVMAGDQHQLGPRAAKRDSPLQTSLFERLLLLPVYVNHPLARSMQRGGTMRRLTHDMLPIARPPFSDLIRNYRSHPAILATISSLFYNDTLEPEAADLDALWSWEGWPRAGWPVLFVSNNSQDDAEGEGGGWYNDGEAEIAMSYTESLLHSGLLHESEICIMSPYRAQVRKLRASARRRQLGGVNIGPVEAFQGLESRLVILCTTRTRNRFIDQDIAHGFGIIHEPRRFNVAMTRAKQGLIVVGNQEVLDIDENWSKFLAYCWRNGLSVSKVAGDGASRYDSQRVRRVSADGGGGSEDDSNMAQGTSTRSRLERQLLYKEALSSLPTRSRGGQLGQRGYHDETTSMWRDGLEAEESIRSDDQLQD